MRRVRRVLVAVAVSLLATSGIGWLARAPYGAAGGGHGLLRLSWRLRGERIESCRSRTAAELAKLPVHMRAPQVCEGRLVAYVLEVQVDDSPAVRKRVLPGGARGDRPVFVLEDHPLSPGPHRVRIGLEREAGGTVHGARRVALDTVLVARAGGIELITLDPGSGRLVHRRSSAH